MGWTQDGRGLPKALIARVLFAAKIGGYYFTFAKKILACLEYFFSF
jgi:hypothetical protein